MSAAWKQPEAMQPTRYHDKAFGCEAVKILPGEYFATDGDMALVTVLGSCVAACLRDPVAGVGGMNHFMLPRDDTSGALSRSARYGAYAMEVLINQLMRMGARRERLEAKVFGGGNVLADFVDQGGGDEPPAAGRRVDAAGDARAARYDRRGVRPAALPDQ